MGIKICSDLVNWDRIRVSNEVLEVEPRFIDWNKVVELANKDNKTIEEVLGIELLRRFSKPPGFDKRLEKRRNETTTDNNEEVPLFYKAAQRMGEKFGATAQQYLAIQRIWLRYSTFKDEELSE